jgi:hypothetical protein
MPQHAGKKNNKNKNILPHSVQSSGGNTVFNEVICVQWFENSKMEVVSCSSFFLVLFGNTRKKKLTLARGVMAAGRAHAWEQT